jgi:hypothetical protein
VLKHHRPGGHGWVFSMKEEVILTGSGPADGIPDLISSFQSELGGILSVLHIIYRIGQFYVVREG